MKIFFLKNLVVSLSFGLYCYIMRYEYKLKKFDSMCLGCHLVFTTGGSYVTFLVCHINGSCGKDMHEPVLVEKIINRGLSQWQQAFEICEKLKAELLVPS